MIRLQNVELIKHLCATGKNPGHAWHTYTLAASQWYGYNNILNSGFIEWRDTKGDKCSAYISITKTKTIGVT
jgi:hypothetical protein